MYWRGEIMIKSSAHQFPLFLSHWATPFIMESYGQSYDTLGEGSPQQIMVLNSLLNPSK